LRSAQRELLIFTERERSTSKSGRIIKGKNGTL
jgi:hypothetical protein